MSQTTQRPYFLWDYDLTDTQVREILHGDNETERVWIMSRILESASFEDVWKYMTLSQVREKFPELKLKKPVRNAWQYALTVWLKT